MKIVRIASVVFAAGFCVAACSTSKTSAGPGAGGATGTGGNMATGGTTTTTGTAPTGSGGQSATGGALSATGGQASGGAATGGRATGGASTGGVATGGRTSADASSTGGVATGGVHTATGGNGSAGSLAGGKGAGGSATGGVATGGNTGGVDAGAGGSAGTCPGGGWAPGKQTINTQWGGVARQYVVYVPKSYAGTSPVPLMLVIHGAHNTPSMAESWSQMDSVSDKNGFIIAYPAGLDCWNAGGILSGCTAADDDLGFLKNVVVEVESHACIDKKRVYATGISNGCMMAEYLGCKAADIFASVGGVAGPTPQPCSPSRPISVFYVHGTADKTVAFSSAQPNVTGWANRDGCNSTAVQVYSQGSATCVVYQGCTAGVEVEFCTVTDMPHCWPDNCYLGAVDFKASPPMWEFFSQHPMP